MLAIGWTEIRGQKFSGQEARAASDFQEVIRNFGIDPQMAYALFQMESLNVGQRLFIAETIPLDDASKMLFKDEDERIREVIKSRMREEQLNVTGGIIY